MDSIFENRQKLSNRSSNDYSFYSYEDDSHSRSPAIPLPKSHIRRTESEANLTENLKLAEFRDQCMFNRLVNGIQKQQQLLYNAEIHDKSRQDSRYRKPRRRSQEDVADLDYTFPARSRRGDRRTRATSSSASDKSKSHSIPIPVPTRTFSKTLLEENNKSIESIICTRQQAMSLRDGGIPSSPPIDAKLLVPNVVTDDEDYDDSDYGMFDLEM